MRLVGPLSMVTFSHAFFRAFYSAGSTGTSSASGIALSTSCLALYMQSLTVPYRSYLKNLMWIFETSALNHLAISPVFVSLLR